jgi:hypothetical protein
MAINGEGSPINDGSGGGTYVAPTSSGGTSTSAPAAVSSPGIGQQLSGVGTTDFALIMGAGGIPVRGPDRTVMPDEEVEITPIPTNLVNAFTAGTPEAAKNGPNRSYWVPSGQPRKVAVRRLNEIWMYSANAGEGVLIQVRKK